MSTVRYVWLFLDTGEFSNSWGEKEQEYIMKIYFESRSKARSVKASSSKSSVKVVDSKSNPSVKGSRWAIDFGSKPK